MPRGPVGLGVARGNEEEPAACGCSVVEENDGALDCCELNTVTAAV